jgi:hypothetical protein
MSQIPGSTDQDGTTVYMSEIDVIWDVGIWMQEVQVEARAPMGIAVNKASDS